jgi:hypothetical protein
LYYQRDRYPHNMPEGLISFGPNLESSYDELGGSSPSAINVVLDKNGVVYKRPGITTYDVAPNSVVDSTGIYGLYATNDSQLFAVGGTPLSRKIYKIANGSASNLSSSPNTTLLGNSRPTFTETEVFFILTGGANIQKVRLDNNVSSRLGGSPPLSSHVLANSSRLLANDVTIDRTKVRFSGISQGTVDTSGHEQWDNTGIAEDGGFFTAEARPDDVIAVHENTNEIFVWGVDNVQIFTPDATNIFSPSATREFGCLAPYSIIKKDQEFFWFDQHRRFVYSDGRTFQNIDQPIKKQLDSLDTVNDCFGYRVLLGHIDCFVWCFPTAGSTFVYQVGGGWSTWNGWDLSQSNFKVFQVLSHTLRRDGGVNVVGTVDGRIGKLSQSAYSDLGELVVARADSGFLDRGSNNDKLCRRITVTGRRGENSSEPLGRLEYRNDTGPWNGPIFIDFGSTGDYHVTKHIHSLGTYKRRQWRFSFSDSANLALINVKETFDILGS